MCYSPNWFRRYGTRTSRRSCLHSVPSPSPSLSPGYTPNPTSSSTTPPANPPPRKPYDIIQIKFSTSVISKKPENIKKEHTFCVVVSTLPSLPFHLKPKFFSMIKIFTHLCIITHLTLHYYTIKYCRPPPPFLSTRTIK